MSNTERIHKIDQLLREQPRTMPELCTELESSESTVKRDIEYMRNMLQAPIVSDRSSNAYRLDLQAQGAARYNLPGLWFSQEEIHALLAFGHFIEQIKPGSLLTPHLSQLRKRLEMIASETQQSLASLQERILILGLGKRSIQSQAFEKIATGIFEGRQIQMRYCSRGKNEETLRIVSPLRLVYYRETWYLDAWCHLRSALRNFSVDRIDGVHVLPAAAERIDLDELSSHFDSSYGMFSGDKLQTAVLRFTAESARWVANEFWHSHQKGDFDEQGRYLLSIPFSDERELLMDILKHGADCEVLGPPELRSKVVNEVKKMQAGYLKR